MQSVLKEAMRMYYLYVIRSFEVYFKIYHILCQSFSSVLEHHYKQKEISLVEKLSDLSVSVPREVPVASRFSFFSLDLSNSLHIYYLLENDFDLSSTKQSELDSF